MLVGYFKHQGKGLITVSGIKPKVDFGSRHPDWVASDYSIRAKCPMKVMAEVPVSTVSDSRSDSVSGIS